MMTSSTQSASTNAQVALRQGCVQAKAWQGSVEGFGGMGFDHGIEPRRLVATTQIKRPSLSQITALQAARTANLYPRRAFIE